MIKKTVSETKNWHLRSNLSSGQGQKRDEQELILRPLVREANALTIRPDGQNDFEWRSAIFPQEFLVRPQDLMWAKGR